MPENVAHHPEIAKILVTEVITAATKIRDSEIQTEILGVVTEITEAQIKVIIIRTKVIKIRIRARIRDLTEKSPKISQEIMKSKIM